MNLLFDHHNIPQNSLSLNEREIAIFGRVFELKGDLYIFSIS